MSRPLWGSLLLASCLSLTAGGGSVEARAMQPSDGEQPAGVVAQAIPGLSKAGASPSPLSPAKARSVAEAILQTLRSGDANARYAQFSADLQRMTSPEMIAATMKTQPRILSYRILAVQPGLVNTSVEAVINTSAGPENVLMIIDEEGKLEGYNINRSDKKVAEVVQNFMDYVFMGHYISARSFLSPELQEDLTPAEIQTRWQNLQRRTGNAVKVKRIVLAETGSNQKLVLVNTEFTRLTDNIFVVLDDNNQIVNLDFPLEPASPAPVP